MVLMAIFVEIHREHEILSARDHIAELDVPYLQFILGEPTVQGLDGDVELKFNVSRTRVGLRSGHGIPSLRGSRRGDLYYTYSRSSRKHRRRRKIVEKSQS